MILLQCPLLKVRLSLKHQLIILAKNRPFHTCCKNSFFLSSLNPWSLITISYSRGVKTTFANPVYNLPDSVREQALLPPEHPDFSPDPLCPPKLLFPQAHRKRTRSQTPPISTPLTKHRRLRPHEHYSDGGDEWDDEEEAPLQITPPKKFVQQRSWFLSVVPPSLGFSMGIWWYLLPRWVWVCRSWTTKLPVPLPIPPARHTPPKTTTSHILSWKTSCTTRIAIQCRFVNRIRFFCPRIVHLLHIPSAPLFHLDLTRLHMSTWSFDKWSIFLHSGSHRVFVSK